MLVLKNANLFGRRFRQVFHAKPKRWSGGLMTEREILRHFRTSLQEKNHDDICTILCSLLKQWRVKETCNLLIYSACLCLPMPFTTGCCLTFFRLQIDCLMILRKHARIALFLVHCLSKSTPQYGPYDMLFLFSPGRCLVIYGKGLALNSMEGSEVKHQAIFWNAFKTNFLNRWKQVFFHEFTSAIWLQEKAYNLISASSCNKTYIPNRNFQSDHCYCGLPVADKRYEYCNSPCRTQITKSAQEMYVSNTRNG